MALTILQAMPDEAPLVYDIMQAAFAEYVGILEPPSAVHTETLDDVVRALEEGGAVLAWLDGEAVGSARYVFRDTLCYIGRVSVMPGYRGRGIATAMVERIEAIARQNGCTEVEITVRLVLESNVRLYERMGYQISEVYQHPKGGGMVGDMTKQL